MRRFVFVLIALLAPSLVLAQGLGDTAARERKKREAAGTKEKARVITNDDLKGPDSGKTTATTSSSSSSTTPGAESSGSYQAQREAPREGDEGSAEGNRLAQAEAEAESARAAVVAAEARVKELQDKLNPMSGSFIYGASGSNDANEEAQVRADLTVAEAQLADARSALVKANQAREDARLRRTRPE